MSDKTKEIQAAWNSYALGKMEADEFSCLAATILQLDNPSLPPINEPPQAGQEVQTAPEESQTGRASSGHAAGPASGSPVEELVGRLEEIAEMRQSRLSAIVTTSAEAAQALRALEAERDKLRAVFKSLGEPNSHEHQGMLAIGQTLLDKDTRLESLQREADQLREFLREVLDMADKWLPWEDEMVSEIVKVDDARISEIRSKMEKAGG